MLVQSSNTYLSTRIADAVFIVGIMNGFQKEYFSEGKEHTTYAWICMGSYKCVNW